MPITELTAETWPDSAAELGRILQEAWHGSSPIDGFAQLVRDLTLLEQKYGRCSAEFYERYQQGKMGDEIEIMRWATKVEMYQELKEDLDGACAVFDVGERCLAHGAHGHDPACDADGLRVVFLEGLADLADGLCVGEASPVGVYAEPAEFFQLGLAVFFGRYQRHGRDFRAQG